MDAYAPFPFPKDRTYFRTDAKMLPRHGIASATDGVVNRRSPRLFGRSSERKNPLNVQFERQVARLESRQQHQSCLGGLGKV
uniref:Uncharacterized protein n=1 Tax=Oryza sativa subsp. japonica TaxID=39947 RepID=Q6Z1Z6_ORYSJ|nr:hypothetical protein [Oryza sativa Japonica Group]